MLVWSSRGWHSWTAVVAMGLAGLAHSAAPMGAPTLEVPPHSLVAAAEALYLRGLPQACDELLKLASMAAGLTEDDLIRVHFLAAMRDLDEHNQLGARRALSQALQLDRTVTPPPSSSDQFRTLFEEIRGQLPPGQPAKSKEARLATARKAASEREPPAGVLLRAVDALYATLHIDGAGIVLELARSTTALTSSDRVQCVLRRGILAMESGDENEARKAFQDALGAEPGALVPDYTPPKTRGIFEEIKLALSTIGTTPDQSLPSANSVVAMTGLAPGHSLIQPGVPPMTPATVPSPTGEPMATNARTWGIVLSGTGAALIVGGTVAGAMALSAYEAEKTATANGDWEGYVRNRDAAGAAVITANGLYGAAVMALGVGAVLFMSAPTDVGVVAGARKGKVSLSIRGSF